MYMYVLLNFTILQDSIVNMQGKTTAYSFIVIQ